VPDSLQQSNSEIAVLTWEHHTTQDAACAIIQAELRRLGHDAKVKWEGYKGTSSVGWGTVFYANGEVTDTAIIIDKIGGALASTVLKECRAMLDRLFPAPHPGQVLPAQLPAPVGDVSAAPEPQSFISIEVTIVNQTGSPLVRVTQDQSWGVYTSEPPLAIGSGQKATLIMESNGFATGAMGSVGYQIPGVIGVFQFQYEAPFIGGNSYDHSCPAGYGVERQGGDGRKAKVTFTVKRMTANIALETEQRRRESERERAELRARHIQQAVITGAIGLVFTILGALILVWLRLK
jgi:hypothetical protein